MNSNNYYANDQYPNDRYNNGYYQNHNVQNQNVQNQNNQYYGENLQYQYQNNQYNGGNVQNQYQNNQYNGGNVQNRYQNNQYNGNYIQNGYQNAQSQNAAVNPYQYPNAAYYNNKPAQRNYSSVPAVNSPYALSTNFSMPKVMFLGIVTLGIYPLVIMSKISTYINTIATQHDGKHTMHYCLVFFIFSWLTLGILPLVWYHNLSSRMGRELQVRNINYSFGARHFWLWNVLGSCILAGPFIYTYKLCKSMNLLAQSYNYYG